MNTEKTKRYGKFSFLDYIGSWIVIAFLLIFSIIYSFFELPIVFAIIPIAFALARFITILYPHTESYILNDNSIVCYSLFKRSVTIELPTELTLIISPVDIAPPLAIRTAVGNQTHILKDKYAVTVLRDMQLNSVLEKLHRPYVGHYTTSIIQHLFDEYLYLYSLVIDNNVLDTLLKNRRCLLIIPDYLSDKIPINASAAQVFVDSYN